MIEDYVYVSTDFSPEQTIEFFWKSLTNEEMEQTVKKNERPKLFTVEAFRRNPEECHSVVRTLNMSPVIWMLFLLNKWRDPVQAQDIIFKGLLRMMQEMTGDIVLLHGGDEVILIRKSDQLLLKNGNEFWVPERLRIIPMPYNMVEMPV
jgi:hypothetical protein